ncbi:MAG: hypothetical protein IJQ21_05735 [Lachnospiraceae bacterium]|nr:hypothetical protein [Lachnospiraceae bacterium]
MENRPEEPVMPIGVPPEKPQRKTDKTAIVIFMVMAVLLVAIIAGIALVMRPLIRNAADRMNAFRTWQEQRQSASKDAGSDRTDAGGSASKDAGSDRTDDSGSADSGDGQTDAGTDADSDELLEQIRLFYRNDFIEEDVVRLTEDLVNEDGYRATICYFLPSFRENSDVACAFFIRLANDGDDTCSFCLRDYQVNARMVLDSDYVTLEKGESEFVLFYLTRELLDLYRATGDVKSAGFRLEVMEGGFTGEVKPALLNKTFLYYANGVEAPVRAEEIAEGELLYEDQDITFRLIAIEKQPDFNRLRFAYEVQNHSDRDMYVNPWFLTEEGERASVPVKSTSNLSAHAALYASGYIEADDFREGLEINNLNKLQINIRVDVFDPNGQTKWEPVIDEMMEVTF